MQKERTEEQYEELVKKFEFAVHTFIHVVDDQACEKYAIVIREKKSKCIVKFTGYEDLLIYRRLKDFNVWSGNPAELMSVCQFLQFVLVDHYNVFRIRDIGDITKEMVEQWIWEYASTPLKNGEFPRKESVLLHRNTVCQFIWLLCDKGGMKKIKKEDVLVHHYIERRDKAGYFMTSRKKIEYKVQSRFYDQDTGLRQLNRDMPEEIVPLFIKVARVYDPEMVFPIVLAAYMGFRGGEICNVRRVESQYGPGIIRTIEDGITTAFQVDLRKELALRKDEKKVGGIKRERMQNAFGGFVKVIDYYYRKHLELIKDKACDASMPLFLNKTKERESGVYKAMTKSGFRSRMKRISKKVLECCKNSGNKELNRYYDKMISMDFSWAPHTFRHWFTVRLVRYGCDAMQLKEFRGDKSIEAAEAYLKNKGILLKEFEDKTNEFGKLIRMMEEI